MAERLRGQRVIVIGATGGLGEVFARTLAAQGARLLLVARRPEALAPLHSALGAASVGTAACDLTDAASIATLVDAARAAFSSPAGSPCADIVVNATGLDVRKPLAAHTDDDIDASLALNLRGAILLTRAWLPHLVRDGAVVHLGGFADGRLAFPFYSVDSATRAGLRAFCEAINRETDGQAAHVVYFSPSPADTEAERPFHPIWREMGTAIVSPEQVARALIRALEQRRRVAIMGGLSVRAFAALNAIAPAWADALLMRRYRAILARFLDRGGSSR